MTSPDMRRPSFPSSRLRKTVGPGRFEALDSGKFMRKAMFLFCGLCWFGFGLAVGVLLLAYLANGAGFQDLDNGFLFGTTVSSGTVLLGLVHVSGLFMLAGFSVLIGFGLFLHGLGIRAEREAKETKPLKSSEFAG